MDTASFLFALIGKEFASLSNKYKRNRYYTTKMLTFIGNMEAITNFASCREK